MVEIHKHRDGLLTGTCLWSLFERMGGLFARVAAGGGPFVFVSMIFSKSLLLFLLPVFAVLLKIVVAFLERKKNTDVQYSKKESILTEAEKSFYTVLREVVGEKYLVCPQVSLSAILSVPDEHDRSRYTVSRNRIQSKYVDFLLCEPESLKPLLVIELNDSSHDQPERTRRDDFLARALEGAGLAFFLVDIASRYDHEDLERGIAEKVGQGHGE